MTKALRRQATVALIGPRQVGKTTRAQNIADRTGALYLDLEFSADRGKLADARLFLGEYDRRLVVLDDIHRAPHSRGDAGTPVDHAGTRAGHHA